MSKKKAIYLKLPADFKTSVVWNDWGPILEDYELEVIEFEAEVETESTADVDKGFASSRLMICVPDEFADCEKVKAFVVKPKKPEVKHERDKT